MEIREKVLPVLSPKLGEEELQALREVFESGWIGKGPKVAQFEKEFAAMVGAKYAVAMTSNTHAMDLVIKALGIKNKDIINPTISFLTTGVVALWNDCTTNIVDVEKDTLCICPEDVKKNLKKDTEVVVAVNMAGVPAKIDEIRSFYDGFIIEDCAHSCYTPGAGTKGDVAIWSFQAVKTMPIFDGGMVTTNDESLYIKLKNMTWLGISSTYDRVNQKGTSYNWDYQVDILGYKTYMTDVAAVIGLEQMKKLSGNLVSRREIQKFYNENLHPLVERPYWTETVQYYCARVAPELRDKLIDYLASKKIHTSVHFKPLHKYDIVKQNRDYEVADVEWLKLISLPVHANMNLDDAAYVVFWVNKFFEENALSN